MARASARGCGDPRRLLWKSGRKHDSRHLRTVRHPGRATDWTRRSCGDVDPGVTRRRRHRGRGGVRRVLAMRKRRCGLDLIWSRVAGWLVTVGASRALPRRPRTDSTSGTEHAQLPHCRGTSVVPGFARLESYLVKAMWGRFPPPPPPWGRQFAGGPFLLVRGDSRTSTLQAMTCPVA